MSIKIVATGPESTGKTTLCTHLSGLYKGTMIPEFGRTYLNKTNGIYQLSDIEAIGITQSIQNSNYSNQQETIFCDTDVLNCIIWAKYKYKVDVPVLEHLFNKNIPDLYLLCYPDLPWEFDPLRESQSELELLFRIYLDYIVKSKAPYCIITGVGRIRFMNSAFELNLRFPELRKHFLLK